VTETMTLGQKLDPRRFTEMSDKMAALVAFVLKDEATFVTEPRIVELAATSDGFIFAIHNDLTQSLIGTTLDFRRNWYKLVDVAGLTPDEAQTVLTRVDRIARGRLP
jgi:hypothetical protein